MAEINIGYRKNDFLWNADDVCDTSDCAMNRAISQQLMDIQHIHNGADERYDNSKNIYNSKLVDTVNLAIGIVACCGFIYYNYDVLKPKT